MSDTGINLTPEQLQQLAGLSQLGSSGSYQAAENLAKNHTLDQPFYAQPNSGGSGSGQPSVDQEASALIKGLNYGEETNPNAGLIQQLSTYLGQLPPAQAQALLKQLPSGTLSTSLTEALSGTPVSSIVANNHAAANGSNSAAPYGFDPLSLGTAFSKVIAPWLSQQQGQNNSNMNSLTSAMTEALKGASPQMQGAMKGIPQEMNAALQGENAAATQSVATAPQYDNLINALTQASGAARTAQSVYGAAPYIAQMSATGTVPTLTAGPATGTVATNSAGLLKPPGA